MEAEIIFESHIPDALRRARAHAGDGMGGISRYVAVAQRDVSTNVRNLDFGL